MSNQARVSNGLLWVFIALYVLMGAARLLHNPHLQRLMPFISVAILMGFAIVHGIRRYGWRHFVFFFIVAFVISWSYETLSILTGFPFGHYIYTDNLGPKLWLVPLLIMPAYFSMGYIAWTLAHVLLDRYDDRLTGAEVVLVPALAFVISWSYETLSILTGFPFGHYIYTDNLGPKLWLVPLLIMPVPRACELRDGDVGSLYRSGQLDDIRLLDLA